MASAKSHRDEGLSPGTILTIAAFNTHADAIHRLRRAAFGLDREDRIAVAERVSAMHGIRDPRRIKARDLKKRI